MLVKWDTDSSETLMTPPEFDGNSNHVEKWSVNAVCVNDPLDMCPWQNNPLLKQFTGNLIWHIDGDF
jgi:hypothetical protein